MFEVSLPRMKCDRCDADAVSFAQGFEPGRSISARCKDHPLSREEMKLMFAAAARSRAAWDRLTPEERQAITDAPPDDREMLWRALVNRTPEA